MPLHCYPGCVHHRHKCMRKSSGMGQLPRQCRHLSPGPREYSRSCQPASVRHRLPGPGVTESNTRLRFRLRSSATEIHEEPRSRLETGFSGRLTSSTRPDRATFLTPSTENNCALEHNLSLWRDAQPQTQYSYCQSLFSQPQDATNCSTYPQHTGTCRQVQQPQEQHQNSARPAKKQQQVQLRKPLCRTTIARRTEHDDWMCHTNVHTENEDSKTDRSPVPAGEVPSTNICGAHISGTKFVAPTTLALHA